MATLIPGALLNWIDRQFHDSDGHPLSLGKVWTYEAGGSTPQNTYADSDLQTPNSNPVQLDADGRATIFLDALGYRFLVTDADDVTIFDIDGISDLAQLYLQGLATPSLTAAVTSGYTVLPTDQMITVNSTSGPNPCLINFGPAADQLMPITLKVIGDTPVQVVASTGETVELNATYDMPAASDPTYPTAVWISNGVDAYHIQASHGL